MPGTPTKIDLTIIREEHLSFRRCDCSGCQVMAKLHDTLQAVRAEAGLLIEATADWPHSVSPEAKREDAHTRGLAVMLDWVVMMILTRGVPLAHVLNIVHTGMHAAALTMLRANLPNAPAGEAHNIARALTDDAYEHLDDRVREWIEAMALGDGVIEQIKAVVADADDIGKKLRAAGLPESLVTALGFPPRTTH